MGGLTVLYEVDRLLSGAALYYYGDNINAPYGEKSEDEIYSLVVKAFDDFLFLGVDAVVIACNTVTAACAKRLRERYPYIIIGMEPAVKLALSRYNTAAVLCTPATAESEKFRLLIRGKEGRIKIICPERLASDVEKNFSSLEGIDLSLHFSPRLFVGADCVVLGCTHYVYIRDRIEKYLSLPTVDGNLGTALHLVNKLTALNLNYERGDVNRVIFLGMSKNNNIWAYNQLKMLICNKQTNVCNKFFKKIR